MSIELWPGVVLNETARAMLDILEFYPGKANIYITDGVGRAGTDYHSGTLKYNGADTAAVDIGFGGETNPGAGRDVAAWLYQFSDYIVELIHTTPFADDDGFYVKNGVKYPGGSIYGAQTVAGHRNHVHFATSLGMARLLLAQLRQDAPTAPPALPTSGTLELIDIASYQAGIDLARAKAAGVQLVNIKTSQGNWYQFGDAPDYARQARELGLGICTFHWLDSSSSGTTQAQIAFDGMKRLGGPEGMAHQLDCEDDASFEIFTSYCDEMHRLLGRPFIIYTGDWWWQARGWSGAKYSPYLWAAPNDGYLSVYPGDTDPAWYAGYGGWPEYSALQYAVQPIAGVGGGDLSRTRMRASVWGALTGQASILPQPSLSTGKRVQMIIRGIGTSEVTGQPRSAIYFTDGIHLRWIKDPGFLADLQQALRLAGHYAEIIPVGSIYSFGSILGDDPGDV